MKVLISDNLGEIGIQMFQQEEGIDVDVNTGLSSDELKGIIGQYDALVIRSATKVTEDILSAARTLKVVGRAGIGLDNVDIPAATKRGVVVMNTPTGNVITTAEHAIGMMVSLSRNIPQGTASLKKGNWDKKKLQGKELFNKVLGIIGFGKIGSIVADRARGLKMQVVIFDPFVAPERIEKAGFESVSLDELYSKADYISVHVPKLKETLGLLDKAAFEKMKDGVMIVNCARGGIVSEADLYEALASGKVAGAALDVFETEPPGDVPLIQLDNVICTPHLGASTKEAQTNVAYQVAEQIIAFLKTGTITNAVNVPSVTGDLLKKLGPFLYLGEKMGLLQSQLICGPITEVSVEYLGEFQGLDLSPVTTSAIKGLLTPIVKDDVNFINAPILAKDRGIKIVESFSADAENYINLIRLNVVTTEMTSKVSGTLFGKKDARVVEINKFRLEVIPEGHAAIIQNLDKPGAIGSIGTTLGQHNINISKMHVGQEEEGNNNIIYLRTDTPITPEALEEIRALPMINWITPLEL
jgi:D-3-phosphoglycerate dehydrogenase